MALVVAGSLITAIATYDQAVFGPNGGTGSTDSNILATTAGADHSSLPSNVALPARLIIPMLSIDAAVQSVGTTTQNTIGVPTNFTDVAWYKYSPKPGEPGNAIIDGHVDNGLKLPGVFGNLHNIQVGDTVMVKDATGAIMHFIVTSKEYYSYDEPAPPELFAKTKSSLLTLITCSGTWIKSAKTYDQRLVVTTRLLGKPVADELTL